MSPDAAASPWLFRLRIALGVAVAAMLLLAYQQGWFHLFGEPSRLKETLLALGPWGYFAFIGAYAVLQPFGMPGTVFVFAAPLVWPWPTAFALSMAGTMAASVVGFLFARFMARDWVLARIPPRLQAYERALNQRAFATVVVLRFLLWMPPMLHAFFGVSRVGFWTHFWGSLIGYTPPLLATAYFGEAAVTLLLEAPAWVWALVAAVTVALLAIAWRHRGRLLPKA